MPIPREAEITSDFETAEPQRDGTIQRFRVVRFFVGKFGPFTLRFGLGEYTAQKVTDEINRRVAEMRELGQLPGAGS